MPRSDAAEGVLVPRATQRALDGARARSSTPRIASLPSAKPIYEARLAEHRAEKRALDARSARISALRGVTFLIAAGLAISRVGWAFPPIVWGAVALASVTFAAFVIAHAVIDTRAAALEVRIRLLERGLARIAGAIAPFPETGERFLVADHAYAGDLDLFGQASLFQLVSAAQTGVGERLLADWLLTPASADEVASRQEAVRELAALHRFREDLGADGVTARARRRETEPLVDWAEGRIIGPGAPKVPKDKDGPAPLPAPPPPAQMRAAQVLSVITVLTMIASETITRLLPDAPKHLWLLPLVVQLAVLLSLRSSMEPILSIVATPEEPFGRYLDLVRRIEGQSFTAPRLAALRATLAGASGEDASRELGKLQRIVGFAELRHSGMIHFLANLVLCWDVWCASALDAFRRRTGPKVRTWLATIAEIEALASLAAFAAEHPDFAFPEVVAAPLGFEAEGLGHPLLIEGRRVPNDVTIPAAGTALMVTGSNMSGKSTLLRAIGLGAVLALAGAPVCAKRLRIGACSVRTSMRIKDSLEEGVSHFYAELGRLKTVVDAVNGGEQVMFLLDEVLHGTNSRERILGARAVVLHLLAKGALGAVSSHDLGLVDLERESGGKVQNVHLEESVDGDQMTFDYTVKPGPVATQNALRLMKRIGIAVAIPEVE